MDESGKDRALQCECAPTAGSAGDRLRLATEPAKLATSCSDGSGSRTDFATEDVKRYVRQHISSGPPRPGSKRPDGRAELGSDGLTGRTQEDDTWSTWGRLQATWDVGHRERVQSGRGLQSEGGQAVRNRAPTLPASSATVQSEVLRLVHPSSSENGTKQWPESTEFRRTSRCC